MSLRLTRGHVVGLSIWLRGLTIEEAADEAKISAGHLSNIIKGRAKLQPDQAMNLGEALGIQPRRLMHPEPYFQRMVKGDENQPGDRSEATVSAAKATETN